MPTVGVLSTQSRKVRHKPPRCFLALPLSDHHRFLPTPQVIDRVFIMVKHMPTDILGSIMYNGFTTGFGPTTPFLLQALGCSHRPTSLPMVRCRLCLWDLHHRCRLRLWDRHHRWGPTQLRRRGLLTQAHLSPLVCLSPCNIDS